MAASKQARTLTHFCNQIFKFWPERSNVHVSRDKTPEEYHIVQNVMYNQILKFCPKMSVTSLDYNPVLYSACMLEESQSGAKIVCYTVPITPVPH